MATLQRRNRQRGKASQKAVAKMIGGLDIGTLGGEDVLHERFSIEVKSLTKFVGHRFMAQCEANNKRKKIPLVFIHLKGTQHEASDLVLVKYKDFKEVFK